MPKWTPSTVRRRWKARALARQSIDLLSPEQSHDEQRQLRRAQRVAELKRLEDMIDQRVRAILIAEGVLKNG